MPSTIMRLLAIFLFLSLFDLFRCNITNDIEDETTEKIYDNEHETRNPYSQWTSEVRPEEAPWMVGIVIHGRIWCAGTIITKWIVLTAAHCFSYVLHEHNLKEILPDIRVCVNCGSLQLLTNTNMYGVQEIIINPTFTGNAPPYTDLAFVVMKRVQPINASLSIRPISVDHPTSIEKLTLPQSFIEITGWGGDKGTNDDFEIEHINLRRTRLKIRKIVDCKKAFANMNGFFYDSEKYFCASFRHGKRDVCVYDAGVPAVQNSLLVGMFIFGPHLCGGGTPAIFIKYGVLADFFDRFTIFDRRYHE